VSGITYPYQSAYAESILTGLKKGIWLYFFLLIFEGALRKWFLPGISEALLIVRDPLAIWLIYRSYTTNLWKPNNYVVLVWGITILAFVLALILGHGNLTVAVFGLRITLLHFPLIFIIGNILDKSDVIKIGQTLLWISIGMTVLVAIQFYSPQSAWVNRGVGGDLAGSGFSGAADFYRVPGTFSFTNGLSLFYGFVAAYVLYFWARKEEKVSKILLLCSTMSLLAAIPLSISRTILFEIFLSFIFLVFLSFRKPDMLKPILGLLLIGLGLLVLLNNFDFFQTATMAFLERFTTASKIEGGIEGTLVDRFLGGMFTAISDENYEFWGKGLGMGTNVGARLMTGGTGVYLIAEGEWGRLIGEMGLILGFGLIAVRTAWVVVYLGKAWAAVGRSNFLPWMLASFGMVNILQGQWAQPTSLGFSVLLGGLIIAAFRENDEEHPL